ncbi:hypothetical protein ACFQRF_12540 [Marinactinospora rubrisoli]|uniref:Uncharacterized protein n=2 Tax=Marinactinospora rubrisoli TaxID=2715399 RepID=A0ABW2KEX5_9ACTN
MARDAIATLLDIPIEDVAVAVVVDSVAEPLAELQAARRAKAEADARETSAMSHAVTALLRQGINQRDAGRLLGISHQRVSQIKTQLDSDRAA